MKKVIDGTTYNTETAKVLSHWDNGKSVTDFDYVEETVMQMRKGGLFIFGEGGARSRYARTYRENGQIMYGAGQQIIPTTWDELER